MITGSKLQRPSKQELAIDTAKALGLADPTMSEGSTVVSNFLDEVHRTLTGAPSGGVDTYRKTELLMQALGLTYDPYWDSSEAAPKGGGTVTTRAYSRIRTAVTGIPRCFVFSITDAPAGRRWETNHETKYRYDDRVSGRVALNEAGPGSKILYYSTRKSSKNKMAFVAHAEVQYIAPGRKGPWVAHLDNYTEFTTPVPVRSVELLGWNMQHAITEISWETFVAILEAGGASPRSEMISAEMDPGGDIVAERVLKDFPAVEVAPTLHIPTSLPEGSLPLREPETPGYEESPDGSVISQRSKPWRSSSDRKRDKLAEQRAIELASNALLDDGWTMVADRQADGVGYDLEFARQGRRLKVEIKGIQGSRLVFNLTTKESWRAETDPEWVVVAVTNVLSPRAYRLHLLDRLRIASARRVVMGYRLSV